MQETFISGLVEVGDVGEDVLFECVVGVERRTDVYGIDEEVRGFCVVHLVVRKRKSRLLWKCSRFKVV